MRSCIVIVTEDEVPSQTFLFIPPFVSTLSPQSADGWSYESFCNLLSTVVVPAGPTHWTHIGHSGHWRQLYKVLGHQHQIRSLYNCCSNGCSGFSSAIIGWQRICQIGQNRQEHNRYYHIVHVPTMRVLPLLLLTIIKHYYLTLYGTWKCQRLI